MPQIDILNDTRSSQPTSSNEISDLIAIPPNWLLRSGITMVAIVAATVLVMSYFIRYPDKMTSYGILTSAQPPIEIVSRSNGYNEEVLYEEGTMIEKGDILLHIDNTTDQTDLGLLKIWIDQYNAIETPKEYLSLSFPQNLDLGEIQNVSGNLELKYNELRQVLQNETIYDQMAGIDEEITTVVMLNESLVRENKIFDKEYQLITKRYDRQQSLFDDGVISETDLETEKARLFQKERQSEEITNQILQNEIQIQQLELKKIDLKDQRFKSIEDYQFSIAQEIMAINTTIINWSRSYNVEAPVSGKIDYITGLTKKKSIKAGEVLGYIIPDGNSDRFLSATYPVTNIGKIKSGQKVLVKFDAFPYKEYGMVESKVMSISEIPEMNEEAVLGYEVIMPLRDTIITDTGIKIPYRPNMTAIAEVITEDRTIFDRIFDQFLGLLRDI